MADYNFSDEKILKMYKIIGQNVKALREKNKITQLELSYKMGYKSVSLVSAAELCTKNKHFNLEHLYKMSKIFDIEISEFLIEIK